MQGRKDDSQRGSLPSRERGLKLKEKDPQDYQLLVAPFTGAWIEIEKRRNESKNSVGRSLHGSVD